VSTGGVAFGAYNPLPGAASDTTGSVTLSCNISAGSVSYTMALTTGGSGSYVPRQMSSGASHLNYNLYLDSARTTVWGDGTGGTQTLSGTSPIVVPSYTQTDNVYGRILANQQSTPPGSYSDTITVTVTYN
jgi:spore coat protein U-like protein